MKTSIVPFLVTSFPSKAKLANTLEIQPFRPMDNSGRLNYTWLLTEFSLASNTTEFRAEGVQELTLQQWSQWPSGGTIEEDEAYQLACIAENLGLIIA